VGERSTEGAELIERVRALLPMLAEQAAEAERLRRPTDASIRALEEAGVFRLMVPRCHGGLELDLDTFLEVGLALGEADASIAWVATFYIEHNWMLCQFPEAFQRELFAGRSHVLAPATVAPTGKARPEDGGFRLSGRWKWGTGVMHAEWVVLSAAADPDGDLASFCFLALPASDVKVEDTWYVDGMLGTGSNDIVVEEVFVPAERTVPVADMVSGRAHGSVLHEAALYRTPMLPILLQAASMPVLGQARAAVQGFRRKLEDHVRLGSTKKQAEKPAVQMRLAHAHIELSQAELLVRDVVADVMARRGAASLEERARWSASFTHVVHQARRVVQAVAEASGASAHFQDQPLQRGLRDVNVASCHVVFDVDTQLELYGRLLLGLEPNSALF